MVDRIITIESISRKLDALPPEKLAELDQFIDFLWHRSALDTEVLEANPVPRVHPAFGIWVDRTDIVSTIDLADELRRKIEERGDGRDGKTLPESSEDSGSVLPAAP
jgi:hypothetical protein